MIIYIHICQKGEWQRSWCMLIEQIKDSGLYDKCEQIRCGILSDTAKTQMNDLFIDPKISIVYNGYCAEYERPTLLHMREAAINNESDEFFYCHTKGIQWYGTPHEENVLDWIKLLIYWNIELWRTATDKLKNYDTYGCNITTGNGQWPLHYSGNFFWATGNYLKRLPSIISEGYTDPEFWICSANPQYFNAFSSGHEGGGHYICRYPEEKYRIKTTL